MTKLTECRSDKVFSAVNYALLSIFVICVLYPLIYILSASFSDPGAVVAGRVWLFPVNFTLEGYEMFFNQKLILSGFMNSAIYVVAGTVFTVFMIIIAAYPLSRSFYGRNAFMFMFFFTSLFNGGLIPTYILIQNLGIMNTRWAMIIPGAVVMHSIVITMTYFKSTIPTELFEAAQLDGCNELRFLKDVVLPLSAPIIAVIVLFSAIGRWNAYFNALIYLNSEQLFPIQLVIRNLLSSASSGEGMADIYDTVRKEALSQLLKYSALVATSIPALVIYPFVQRHFVKGIMIGSLKG